MSTLELAGHDFMICRKSNTVIFHKYRTKTTTKNYLLYSCVRIRVNIQIISKLLSKMGYSHPRESGIQTIGIWEENLNTYIDIYF